MVLLDGGCWKPGDANAVAAHFHELRLAVFTEERGVHGLAVFGAQIEHMADFNAALYGQYALAVRRSVAFDHIANVGHQVGFRQVPPPINTGDVKVGLVGSANPVSHGDHIAIGHNFQGLLQSNWAKIARLAAKVGLDLGHGRKAECSQSGQLADLDFVHVVVATHQQQPDLGFDNFALVIQYISRQHQRLDRDGQGHTQQFGHIRASAFTRSGCFGKRLGGCRTRSKWSQGFGLFHVRRVVAGRAVNNRIFACSRNHLKFFT